MPPEASVPAPHHHPALQEQFDNLHQQQEASTLGMWVFLATEIMFFGGAILAYITYRYWYPEVFQEASHHLNVLLGAVNTGVLICSSLTMAMAVWASQTGRRTALMTYLALTILLGVVFLGIKFYEYYVKWEEHLVPGPAFQWDGFARGQAQMFFSLYFFMTGLHALHMIIGFGILSVMLYMSYKDRFSPEYYTPIEVSGLYWHFVDIVWIFLFPLLYLVAPR